MADQNKLMLWQNTNAQRVKKLHTRAKIRQSVSRDIPVALWSACWPWCFQVDGTVGKAAGQAAGQACQVRDEVLGNRGMWLHHSGPERTDVNDHELNRGTKDTYIDFHWYYRCLNRRGRRSSPDIRNRLLRVVERLRCNVGHVWAGGRRPTLPSREESDDNDGDGDHCSAANGTAYDSCRT